MSVRSITALLFATSVGGCGLTVPDIQDFPGTPRDGQLLVQSIVTSVHCEIANAVRYVIDRDTLFSKKYKQPRYAAWLETWGVQVALTLTMDEKTTLNANAVGMPASPATAVFTIGAGAAVSAGATRTDTLNFFYTVRDLYNRNYCQTGVQQGNASSPLVRSDLKLKEWLQAQIGPVATQDVTPPSDPGGPLQRNALSHEVKFVLSTSGNLNPAWTLVSATINQGGTPFFSTNRDRTHDLTITFGPNGGKGLDRPAADAHLARQIGLSVSTNLRPQLQQ